MPSTYTTNNGLEKIGTGEQSGTWGDTTNLNFDILDQALDGLVTITATDTGSSGSPNSLPITDGTLSDGRNRLIIITDGGDLGGSVYYQLTPPDAEKIVFLRNSLSGSRDLILFQGSYNAARDLIVPAGKDVIVKFSGTGTSTAVVAPVFADLSLDAATIASADINGGTIDGVTIGVTSVATVINVDNLKLDGNTLSSTDTNGNVVLAPNGDGDVQLDADTVRVGDNNNDVTITTNGTGDLTLNTNGGTNSGSIEIQDGVNTNIIVTANGTGKLELANGDITTSASSGSDAAGQDLTIQAGASTGNAAGGDMIFQTTPAGAGSGTNLNSYTTVLTLTDDSKMQIGTSTAVGSILDEDDMSSNSDTALATQQSIKAYVDSQVGAQDTLSEILANGNTTGGTNILMTSGDSIAAPDASGTDQAGTDVIVSGGAGTGTGAGGELLFKVAPAGSTGSSVNALATGMKLDSTKALYVDTINELTSAAGVTIDSVLLKDDVVNATDIETSTISANDGTTAINIADSTGAVDIDTSLNVDGTATVDGLTVDDAGTIQLTKNTTAAGDSLGILEFHDEDGTTTGDAGKFQIKGVRGGDKDAPDLQFIGSDSVGTLTKRLDVNGGGDITFYDAAGNSSFVYDVDSGTTINNNQDARDFTVKSDNSASMLVVDGTNDRVGISTGSPQTTLQIGSTNPQTTAMIAARVNGNALEWGHGNTTSGYYGVLGTNINNGNPFIGFSASANSGTGNTYDTDGFIGTVIRGSTGGQLSIEQLTVADQDNQSGLQRLGISATEAVFNAGSSNTNFRVESNTDQYALFVDGNSGGVQMGGSADQFTGMGGAADGRLSLVNTGNGHAQLGLFRKDTSISGGNTLGEIIAFTDDTADNDIMPVVKIAMTADGTFSATDNPTKLEFYTTPDASETIRQVGYFNNTGKFYANFGAEINTSQNNPNGDFKVSSSSNANMLFVDAGTNEVGVGTSNPDATMHVYGSLTVGKSGVSEDHDLKMWPSTAGRSVMGFRNQDNYLALMSGDPLSTDLFTVTTGGRGSFIGGLTVNENSGSAEDFQVKSDGNANMFTVNAGNNRVGVGTLNGLHTLSVFGTGTALGGQGHFSIGTGALAYQTTVFRLDANNNFAIDQNYASADRNRLFIERSTGFIGVGTESPDSMITIKNTGTNMRSLRVYSSGSAAVIDLGVGTGQTNGNDAYLALRNQNAADVITLSTDGVTVFNDNGDATNDFRVGSDSNAYMLFLDASVDRISIGSSSSLDAQLTVQNAQNNGTIGHLAGTTISNNGVRPACLEMIHPISTVSSGNLLTIPITSQGGLWVQYQVELMVVTGEYNINTNARGGSAKFSFTSLNVVRGFVQQEVTGNISSVEITQNDSSAMNVRVNFSGAYTSGSSSRNGVCVYAKVLSYAPQYFQLENATLN